MVPSCSIRIFAVLLVVPSFFPCLTAESAPLTFFIFCRIRLNSLAAGECICFLRGYPSFLRSGAHSRLAAILDSSPPLLHPTRLSALSNFFFAHFPCDVRLICSHVHILCGSFAAFVYTVVAADLHFPSLDDRACLRSGTIPIIPLFYRTRLPRRRALTSPFRTAYEPRPVGQST